MRLKLAKGQAVEGYLTAATFWENPLRHTEQLSLTLQPTSAPDHVNIYTVSSASKKLAAAGACLRSRRDGLRFMDLATAPRRWRIIGQGGHHVHLEPLSSSGELMRYWSVRPGEKITLRLSAARYLAADPSRPSALQLEGEISGRAPGEKFMVILPMRLGVELVRNGATVAGEEFRLRALNEPWSLERLSAGGWYFAPLHVRPVPVSP